MSEDATVTTEPVEAQSIASVITRMAHVLHPVLGKAAIAESRELLALVHEQPRYWATLHGDQNLSPAEVHAAMGAAARRAAGAPLAYAAGRAAFRHLMLEVDERVLIPRPETELLVDIVLELTRDGTHGAVVDVGTGSGAIALALASEGAFAHVIGTDVSRDALAVARANAARNASKAGTRIDFRHGSLLAPVPERGLCAVVSNPPYISHDEADALPASVRDWEPAVALFSGANGMDATARLVREAALALAPSGVLAIEVDARRAALAMELVATHGAYHEVRVQLDLTGRERFVVARRLEEWG